MGRPCRLGHAAALAVGTAVAVVALASGARALDLPEGQRPVARRQLARGTLVLAVDDRGDGHLHHVSAGGQRTPIPCERLEGAWGLWLDDVDGDGRAEALVALRKRARFDPEVHNRLHVYSFERGRCVPAWRGTRLAGRFEDLAVDAEDRGALLAWERVEAGVRRVARYRWRAFGYRLEQVLWRGEGRPPARLRERFGSLRDEPPDEEGP